MPPPPSRWSDHVRAALACCALAASIAGCGGGGGTASGPANDPPGSGTGTGSGTGSGTGGAPTGSGNVIPAEGWNLASGHNPADLPDGLSFERITIALDTLSVGTASAALRVGSTGASGTTLTIDGRTVVTVTQDTLGVTIDADLPAGLLADFVLSGRSDRTVTVHSAQPFRLTLAGVHIASADGPAINIQSQQRAHVRLADGSDNVLGDTATYTPRTLPSGKAMDLKATFFSEGPLVFGGGGALAITAASRHALASDAHVRVRDGRFELRAHLKDGLRANHAVVIDGGRLQIRTPAGKGLKVEGKEDSAMPLGFITVNGGQIDIVSHGKAISASWVAAEDGKTATLADDPDPRVTINGGTLTLTTTGAPFVDRFPADGDDSLSPEGIEAKSVLTINDGLILIHSTDDALNAGRAIVINGGRILARSSLNDGIDSNGSLSINGGIIVAEGRNVAGEGGMDCDFDTFAVTGGTFVAIGARNSIPTAAATTQNVVALRNVGATTLVVRDGDGRAVFAYDLPRSALSVLLSAPTLASGGTYDLVFGGTASGFGDSFHGLSIGSGTVIGGGAVGSFMLSGSVTSL